MISQVVNALVNLLVSIDVAADSEIDPDFAVSLQGRAATVFDALTNDERHEVARLVRDMARLELDSERKSALGEFIDAYGLEDDD
ncbi:hypothetical protein [Micromonospora sp. NPDC049374]|uniref:hypothetical protein n=1 Tax=Micromonospora sp. NPDC049374 TaxID=3154352 RepID=UPI0034351345